MADLDNLDLDLNGLKIGPEDTRMLIDEKEEAAVAHSLAEDSMDAL